MGTGRPAARNHRLEGVWTVCKKGHGELVKPACVVAGTAAFGSAVDFCQRRGCGEPVDSSRPVYGGRGVSGDRFPERDLWPSIMGLRRRWGVRRSGKPTAKWSKANVHDRVVRALDEALASMYPENARGTVTDLMNDGVLRALADAAVRAVRR